jgi:hypothetical protein
VVDGWEQQVTCVPLAPVAVHAATPAVALSVPVPVKSMPRRGRSATVAAASTTGANVLDAIIADLHVQAIALPPALRSRRSTRAGLERRHERV